MKQFRFVLFLCFLFSCFLLAQTATTVETQALVGLYNATNGTNWKNSTRWTTGDPCANSWYGVLCTNATSSGSVTFVNLGFNQLNGTIPSSFGNLVNLQSLDLTGNNISGTIPSSFGNFTNLENLNLSGNNISGTIPSFIGNFTNLQLLYLYSNRLSGIIPSSFGNLKNLKYLFLNNNYLTGNLTSTKPASIAYYFNNNYFCNKPSWCGPFCSTKTNPFYELYSSVKAVSVTPSGYPYTPTLSDLQIQVFGCDSNFTNYVVFKPSSINSVGNTSVNVSLSFSNNSFPLKSVVVVVNVIPASVTINCSSTPVNVSLSSSGNSTLDPSYLATASELGVNPLVFSSNVTSLNCSNVGTNYIKVTATSPYGTSASCSTTINVVNPFVSVSCIQGVVIGLNGPNFTANVSSSQVDSAPNPCSVPVNVSPSNVSTNNFSSSPINFTVTSSTNSSETCTSTGYVVINGILNVGSVEPVGTGFNITWNNSYTSLFSNSSKVTLYYLDQNGLKETINSSPVNYSVGQFDWVQGFPSSLKVDQYYTVFMSINGKVVGIESVYLTA